MRRSAISCSLAILLSLAGCGEGQDAAPTVDLSAPLFGDAPGDDLDLRVRVEPREVELFGELVCILDLYEPSIAGARADEAREDEASEDEKSEGATFTPIVPEGFAGEFTAEPSRPVETGGTWRRFRGALRPTELGELTIRPFEVKSGESVATTPEVLVIVGSALEGSGEDAAAEVEAPAPLFPERQPLWPWFAGLGGLVALLAGIWFLRRLAARARDRDSSVVGTPLPPHVQALRALGRLRSAPRATAAEIETFYVEVSQILRVYLEGRFGLHAPERTTEEFLPEVERSGLLDVSQSSHLRQFLEQCDLVKFAAVRPGMDVHDATFEFAEDFVESTRPERGAMRPAESREPAEAVS